MAARPLRLALLALLAAAAAFAPTPAVSRRGCARGRLSDHLSRRPMATMDSGQPAVIRAGAPGGEAVEESAAGGNLPRLARGSPPRLVAAAAAAAAVPLAAAAEEVTAFKASGAADALGSLELGVLLLGIAVRSRSPFALQLQNMPCLSPCCR